MVLANAKSVRVVIPADDEATRMCLHLLAFSLSIFRLGGCHRTCQTPMYLLSEVKASFLATTVVLVAVSKATVAVSFWSTDFLLVAA